MLQDYLSDEEEQIVNLIEDFYGDTITIVQAFFIGKVIGMFGPKRVYKALLSSRDRKDPVRYAYALLVRNQLGKPKAKPTEEIVQYPTYEEWSGW